ncbi:unnamed protein product [Sympodiomycopsis kandeliae]
MSSSHQASVPEVFLRRPQHFSTVSSSNQPAQQGGNPRQAARQGDLEAHLELQRLNGLPDERQGVRDLITGIAGSACEMLHIVPVIIRNAQCTTIRLMGHFSWERQASIKQRNSLKNVFPGPSAWHSGVDHGFEVALLPTMDALKAFIKTLEQHLAQLELSPSDKDAWTMDLAEMENRTSRDCQWPAVSGKATFPLVCAALPAWEGAPMWGLPFEIHNADSHVEFKARKHIRPVYKPTQLPVQFQRLDEDGVSIGDVTHTPARFTYLSMVSVLCFAFVEWSLREATVANETRSLIQTSMKNRPKGQDWLKETEGMDNPNVERAWVDGYKSVLRYAVKLVTSSTPSSFRSRSRPTSHLGFSVPATPDRTSRAPRNFVWDRIQVGPRVKKNRRAPPEDRSSSPLDTSMILQRWLEVLEAVDEEEASDEFDLGQLIGEHGSAQSALDALTNDLQAAFWNAFIQEDLDVEDLLLRGFSIVPGSARLSKELIPTLEELAKSEVLPEASVSTRSSTRSEDAEGTMSQSSSGDSLSSTETIEQLEALGIACQSTKNNAPASSGTAQSKAVNASNPSRRSVRQT